MTLPASAEGHVRKYVNECDGGLTVALCEGGYASARYHITVCEVQPVMP